MNDQRTYFDESAHRYPQPNTVNPPYAQRLEMEHLHKSIGALSGNNILDFGAGSGRVTFWFLKQGYDVTAVDISKKSLSALEQTYKKHKTSSWGLLKTANRLPTKKFDAIVGADILHHVSIKEVLPMLIKVLRSGGAISFSEPNAWHLLWYIHYWFSGIPWHIENGILQCTYYNLKKLFHHEKFRNVTLVGHGLFPTTPLSQFPSISIFNIRFGNYWPFKLFAFRYIISGEVFQTNKKMSVSKTSFQ